MLYLFICKNCSWVSFSKVWVEDGSGGGEEYNGCIVRCLRWVESRMRRLFSCNYRYVFMEKGRCFRMKFREWN